MCAVARCYVSAKPLSARAFTRISLSSGIMQLLIKFQPKAAHRALSRDLSILLHGGVVWQAGRPRFSSWGWLACMHFLANQ